MSGPWAWSLFVSGFFAGVVLLYVRTPVSWPLSVAICGVAALEAWPTGGPGVAAYQLCSAFATALTVYGLTRLAALVTELSTPIGVMEVRHSPSAASTDRWIFGSAAFADEYGQQIDSPREQAKDA